MLFFGGTRRVLGGIGVGRWGSSCCFANAWDHVSKFEELLGKKGLFLFILWVGIMVCVITISKLNKCI